MAMKATGIVRRIDDLGRVVIPKEIRRTMRIREGDPLEIYTDRDGEVIFKKYSPIGEMGIFAAQYADTLAKTCGMSIAVFDRDSVIACSGIPKKEYMERKPSEAIEKIMEKRAFFNGEGENTLVIREDGSRFVSCAMPIQSAGDIVGCVVSVKENGDNARDVSREAEHKLIQTAAGFLGRQLEE
ncbi:MAG: AbrB/MazE/SpoVT family DNA-binding domain-containing protein [Clostridia bacterium]|nr:AbrB/MazE/SpoVT family DNA-binding domain-containing protein [Clostridia bacterium]